MYAVLVSYPNSFEISSRSSNFKIEINYDVSSQIDSQTNYLYSKTKEMQIPQHRFYQRSREFQQDTIHEMSQRQEE